MARIPRRLIRIWLGGEPMPTDYEDYLESWKELLPGWELTEYRAAPLTLFSGALRSRYKSATDVREQADILRYVLLREFGGVYVDCDVEPRKSLEPLLDETEEARASGFLGWESEDYLCNAVIGAMPHSTFLTRLLTRLPNYENRETVNERTGPIMLTKEWTLYGSSFMTYPAQYFYPYHHTQLERAREEFPDAYAVHHWAKAAE